MLNWKETPYWLKGIIIAFIFLAISIILGMLAAILIPQTSLPLIGSLEKYIITPILSPIESITSLNLTKEGLFGPVATGLGYLIFTIIVLILGKIIGAILGKIKK